jgi:glutathione synthase/RimK-type ligase-like ATP-grasp enzyme
MGGLWRRPGTASIRDTPHEFQQFAASECRDALEGSLAASGIRWITPPDRLALAERKPFQLQVARDLGLPVPPTLITNARRDALNFIRTVGVAVAKPVRYGLVSSSRPAVAYTRVVTTADVESLTGPPVILQALIPARRHLRVVTIGRRVFLSSLTAKELDWRSLGSNHDRFRKETTKSAPGVAQFAVALAARLGVGFSSQDWIVDEEGRPWFLEANPNGQWLFLDPPHGGAITDALASALERLSR